MFNSLFTFDNLQQLLQLIANDGLLAYFISTCIIFFETAMIACAWLPGDSLLFTVGTLAGLGHLNIHLLTFILVLAAITGTALNYGIGRYCQKKVQDHRGFISRYIKSKHLHKTENFFTRFGILAICISPFLPFARTFIPFLAGIAQMPLRQFMLCNILGALLWVGVFLYGSFYLGHLPLIRDHLHVLLPSFILIALTMPILPLLKKKLIKPIG